MDISMILLLYYCYVLYIEKEFRKNIGGDVFFFYVFIGVNIVVYLDERVF